MAELVRAQMVKQYGQAAYTEGYHVFTTIDASLQNTSLQKAADATLRRALLNYDARHGYRGPVKHVALPKLLEPRNRALRHLPGPDPYHQGFEGGHLSA